MSTRHEEQSTGREGAAPAATDFLFPSGPAPTQDAYRFASWGAGAGPAGFWALGNAEQSLGRRNAWVSTSHQMLCRALRMARKGQSPQHRTQVCTPRLPCSPDLREQAEKHMERQWRRISPMLVFGLCLRSHFIQFLENVSGPTQKTCWLAPKQMWKRRVMWLLWFHGWHLGHVYQVQRLDPSPSKGTWIASTAWSVPAQRCTYLAYLSIKTHINYTGV